MKKCCLNPNNLRTYGTAKKQIEPSSKLLVVRYTSYIRCTLCGSPLKAEVVKTIRDREVKAKIPQPA